MQQKAIILKFRAKGGHYQSEGLVCNQGAYADSRKDAVDRLLIFICIYSPELMPEKLKLG